MHPSKLVLIFTMVLIALEAGAAGDGTIPTKMIKFQILNISIFIGLVVYFVRPIIKKYFFDRKKLYEDTVNKAANLRAEADQQKKEIEEKIAGFKAQYQKEVESARSEAQALKDSIVSQGDTMSATIKAEAKKTVENEVAKAKLHLRQSLLDQSLNEARERFANKLNTEDHKTMNKRFLKNLEAN